MAASRTAKKTAPRKKAAALRPTSNAALARRLSDLDERVAAIEKLIAVAELKKQQALAAKLAQDPAQLAQLESVLKLARQQGHVT